MFDLKFMPLFGIEICQASVSSSVFGQDDGSTDENRPYKFAFNIEGYQHRSEEKDESGIIMGQFGFVTGDGVYHVTVYATDKDGDFKILSMKSYYIGLPGEPTTPKPPPAAPTTKNPILQHLDGLKGCSSCVIPSKKTESTPNNVPGGVSSGKPTRPGENQFNKDPGFGNGQRPQGGSKAPIGSTGVKPENNFGGVGKPQQPGKPPGFSNAPNGGQNYKPSGGPTGGGKTPITGSKPSPFDGASGSKTPFANPETPLTRPVSQDPNLQTGNPPKSGSPVSSGTPNPNPTKYFDGLPPGMSMEDLQALLYKFNYTLRFHGHHESGYRSGDKEGGYFFNGRDGFGRDVKYIANEFGYQPNISLVELGLNSPDTPKEDTEKELNELRGNEFKWFYQR